METNVDKYISKFASRIGESISKRSRYYQIEDKIIRVSDHIGKHSDGIFQIIVKPNGYLIYHPGTGTINICNYRQVQEFIRTVSLFPVEHTTKQVLIVADNDDETIFGIPANAFSGGQLATVKNMVNKIKNKNTIC